MIPLKNDFCYAILDDAGAADASMVRNAGFYLHDTRHLSVYDWNFPAMDLLHRAQNGNSVTQFWSRLENHAQTLLIRRVLRLEKHGLIDSLEIENSSDTEIALPLDLKLDADFVDVFQARGYRRIAPANPVTQTPQGFSYLAQDGVVSSTEVSIEGLDAGRLLTLAPRSRHRVTAKVKFTSTLSAAQVEAPDAVWSPKLRTDLSENERVVLGQAVADIDSLILHTGQGRTIAAGIPNFVVPFGRDSIITAWLLLDVDPELSHSVLSYLASRQGSKEDGFHDEEPGKIMHEHRECELSRIGELPFRTYYGSADSTPLFLVLLGDYVARTGNAAFAREMEQHWRAALAWIEHYSDARGLINFRQRADGKGLTIQSWKDSQDSMSYGDGQLADGSLAVAEVQGYVFAAYRAAAELSRLCGGPEAEQRTLLDKAEALARAFDAAFWMPEHDNYALGLDADGRQLDVNASDSGHLLWSGIVPEAKAQRLIARLFQPDLWSGYGLRTLSAKEKRYNPLSYHNGSVWPHDTALFAAGLKRYGAEEGFGRVREALTALATASDDKRLPELVGGYPREGDVPPLPYIESCRPQAWAAAALIYVLNA
ncbi:MAG: hypothetical protein ABS76_21420 [Pelagibacterium sp. SCN 64-44]|nr:MAG: hypothetical protein ABS76_21420 [Pelagibacterium sp. SCN 64-44]